MSEKEINVVIWSGGLDSTLVLDRLCSPDMKQCIWAHTINWHMLNDLKREKEKEARRNYLKYAKEKGYDIAPRTIRVTANMGATDIGPAQALAWFSYVIPYLPKNSIVHFGYHSTDEFWRNAGLFDKFIESAAEISGRKIKLNFPLQFMGKRAILEEFDRRKIPSNCFWTCENPNKNLATGGRCGKCVPCINLKTARYESKLLRKMEMDKEE